MSETAWAAGLYEGEGWVFTRPQQNGQGRLPRVNIGLASTDVDVLRRFRDTVAVGAIGEVRQRPGQKPLYCWTTGRWPDVVAALELLRPWLGERRGQRADEVLAVWNERKHLYQDRRRRQPREVA